VLVAVLLTLAAAAFVLAPLFRADAELEPLVRSRSGVRQLAGPEGEGKGDAERPQWPVRGAPAEGCRCCPHCGAAVRRGYVFCGSCAEPCRREPSA